MGLEFCAVCHFCSALLFRPLVLNPKKGHVLKLVSGNLFFFSSSCFAHVTFGPCEQRPVGCQGLGDKATSRDGDRPRQSPAEGSPTAKDQVLGMAKRDRQRYCPPRGSPAETVTGRDRHRPRLSPPKMDWPRVSPAEWALIRAA